MKQSFLSEGLGPTQTKPAFFDAVNIRVPAGIGYITFWPNGAREARIGALPPETNALSQRTRIEVNLIDERDFKNGRVFNRPTPRLRARGPQTNKLLIMRGDTRFQTSIDNGLLSGHFGRRNLRRQPTTLGRLSDEWIKAVLDPWRIDNFNAESPTFFRLIDELY